MDQLNFLSVPDDDFGTIDVDPLEDGPSGNRGYLPTPYTGAEQGQEFDRRQHILEQVMELELQRSARNISRNS